MNSTTEYEAAEAVKELIRMEFPALVAGTHIQVTEPSPTRSGKPAVADVTVLVEGKRRFEKAAVVKVGPAPHFDCSFDQLRAATFTESVVVARRKANRLLPL